MCVINYNITPDHKYCSLIHHLVATHNVHHNMLCIIDKALQERCIY